MIRLDVSPIDLDEDDTLLTSGGKVVGTINYPVSSVYLTSAVITYPNGTTGHRTWPNNEQVHIERAEPDYTICIHADPECDASGWCPHGEG